MPTLTNRWAVLALLFLVRTSIAIQFQSIPPIIPFLIVDLEINYTQVGLLIGLFMSPGIFLSLPGGVLGHRFGDKPILLTGLALLTLGALLFANSNSLSLAFAARLLGGIGAVLLNVQIARVVTDWFAGREIATAMALQTAGLPIGMAISLASLGSLAGWASWHFAIYITAIPSAAVWVLVMVLYRVNRPRDVGAASERIRLWTLTPRETGLSLSAGMLWMFNNTGFIVFMSFVPTLLIARGVSIAQAGLWTSLASWISVVSVPLGGYLTDRTGKNDLFIAGGAVASALTIWMIPLGGPALLWIFLFGITRGAGTGGVMTLPGQVLREESRSTGFGVFYTVFFVGVAIFPPLAGYLLDITKEAAAPVWFAGSLLALTYVFLIIFRLLQRRWGPEQA